MRKTTLLILFFGLGLYLKGQEISGTVRSSADLRAVQGVEISIKNSEVKTTTDRKGAFTLAVKPDENLVLLLSHPDHDPLELKTGGQSRLDITMQSNVRFNQYMVRVNRNPLFVEERNGILVFESPESDYRFWFDIRVQADGAVFSKKVMNPIGNGTSIRRARFAAKVEFGRGWYGELDLDFSNSEMELKDAYLQYTFNNGLELKAGNFKEGFSMESTTTSRYLTFMERPMVVSAFAPSRHIGIAATYGLGPFLGIGGIHFKVLVILRNGHFRKPTTKRSV